MCSLLGMVCLSLCQAQQPEIALPEIEISAQQLLDYAVGSKQKQLDSLQQSGFRTRTLADLLKAQTPVYFKTYGNGMLATPTFRGTSAMHTAVLWNGFPIDLPTLGQVDFSQVPVNEYDQIRVQYGGGSTLFGSGAIGGSIHLDSRVPDFRPRTKGTLQYEMSSLSTQSPWAVSQLFGSADLQLGTADWQSRTRAYGIGSDNQFTYLHPRGYRATQQQAAFGYKGLMQDVFLRPGKEQLLALQLWYHQADRKIQSTLGDHSPADELLQENLRLTARYRYKDFLLAGAYFRDLTDFNQNDPTETHRWMARVQWEPEIGERLFLQTGARLIHLRAHTQNYVALERESRWSAFALLRWEPLSWWTLSAHARQEAVSGYQVPFTPSLGSQLTLFREGGQSLYLKTTLSRSFRLPTLNERYWQPGGNPNIRPERGYNAEAGLQYQKESARFFLNAELTVFNNYLEDWVLWLPERSVWTPRNVQEVVSQGVELQVQAGGKLGEADWKAGGTYGYTRSQFANGDFRGNQLPYTPRHQGAVFLDLLSGHWHGALNGQFTGRRYLGSDEGTSLDGFWLCEIRLSRQFDWKKHGVQLGVRIENLLNTNYQNLSNHAMPLRTYHLSLRYTFDKK